MNNSTKGKTMDNLNEQVAKCESDEKKLSKISKKGLELEVRRHHRVVDLRECTKWDLIAMILRARYGVSILKNCKGWS